MSANIIITGKYKDVDLTAFNEDQLHYVFTLINQIERQDKRIVNLEQTKKIYIANRSLMHQMFLQFNYLQNSYNENISSRAKRILEQANAIREELGQKPLKLPDLKAKPQETIS